MLFLVRVLELLHEVLELLEVLEHVLVPEESDLKRFQKNRNKKPPGTAPVRATRKRARQDGWWLQTWRADYMVNTV